MTSSQQTTIPLHSLLHFIPIKLSPTNYLSWKNQIQPVLSSQGLLGHVDGSTATPPKNITVNDKTSVNPDFTTWTEKDQTVRLLIQSSLSEEAMAEIIGLTSAKDIWLALENAYINSSLERVYTLQDTLRQMQKGSATVAEYGRKFKSLCDQLAAIGHPPSENDKCHWFLRGLGNEFQNFSTVHRALSGTSVFRDLLAKAENHEIFVQTMNVSSTPPAAFTAQSVKSGNSSRNFQSSYSTNRGRSRGMGRGRVRRPPHCQLCRNDGHYANVCPNLSTFAQRAPILDANLAQAFHAQCHVTQNHPDWTTDTGATAHMTPTSDDLANIHGATGSPHEANPSKRNM
ncbi:putative RNA-directed DNA polymerase [Helianthus annuus]|nr:putative RNA-directed DNA polymerase [Helianthus annuus]